LILLFSLLLVILFIFELKLYFKDRQDSLLHQNHILKENYQILIKEKEDLSSKNFFLTEKIDQVATLYEITKDITLFLKEEEIFDVFKEKIKRYLDFKDCQLLDSGNNKIKNRDYFTMPIWVEKDKSYSFSINGLKEEDKDKLFILTGQLTLFLRRARLYQRLQELAITDSLTGLFNRRYFLERFEEEFKRAKKFKLNFSLLMIDIDHFKSYNDRYGHLTGDIILKEIAQILKTSIRQIDLVSRFGGEEFAVILPKATKETASFVAERIRKTAYLKSIKTYDDFLNVTLSIGVSGFPEDGNTFQELLDKADWALYRAKECGRNQIQVYGIYK
ncbi:MAG: GGDEF domain-containing protein, partial [Candidatus Omnitrophota bacterium]